MLFSSNRQEIVTSPIPMNRERFLTMTALKENAALDLSDLITLPEWNLDLQADVLRSDFEEDKPGRSEQ